MRITIEFTVFNASLRQTAIVEKPCDDLDIHDMVELVKDALKGCGWEASLVDRICLREDAMYYAYVESPPETFVSDTAKDDDLYETKPA